jgi:N-acyl-D-amino-acid deacylase
MSPTIDRRRFLGACGALVAASACRAPAGETECELLLVGATVVDGTGRAPFVADVGLRAGRIHFIGTGNPRRARRVLDVSGLVLAPGFVDIHTHSDRTIFEWPLAQSRIRQGCTTEITGNCGGSAAPHDEDGGRWSDVESTAARGTRTELRSTTRCSSGRARCAAASSARSIGRRRRKSAPKSCALRAGARSRCVGPVDGPRVRAGDLHAAGRGARPRARRRRARSVVRDAHAQRRGEAARRARRSARTARAGNARLQVSHLKAAGRNNWKLQDEASRASSARAPKGSTSRSTCIRTRPTRRR